MKIGFVGLGKLGLPTAVAIASRSHNVVGFDVNRDRMTKNPQDYLEAGPDGFGDFNEQLAGSSIEFGSLEAVVDHAEIIFVAVQTPHHVNFEGVTPLSDKRVDFNYNFLRIACEQIAAAGLRSDQTVAIVSTVLPGTTRREIMPAVAETGAGVVYNPSFIAMGTTMRDFLNPEFVLIGAEDDVSASRTIKFYNNILEKSVPVFPMTIESAELAKVLYNTFITLKIDFANTAMEICEKIPMADVDDVMMTIRAGHRRITSGAYMTAGMGDGGGCHPRDNIALSWLARSLNLSYDLFEAAMVCRERQAWWLARMMLTLGHDRNLPLRIIGYAFKPGTNIIEGSPARLVATLIRIEGESVKMADWHVDGKKERTADEPAVYLIGCRHEEYAELKFAPGSVVIDPHRIIPLPADPGVRVYSLGRGE